MGREAVSREPIDPEALDHGYTRYLIAKKSVDDRALNRRVLANLCRVMPAGALRVLEIGAGLGTMVALLLESQDVAAGAPTMVEVDPPPLAESIKRLT